MKQIPLRIFRSYRAKYYEDDILQGPTAYPQEYFEELAKNGFNAVWLRAILRDLAPSNVFPTIGHDIARHQNALGTVIERGARHGVKVMLYFNEPLCLPQDNPFWAEHPEVRGASGDSMMDEWPKTYTFCTSTPQVRQFIREGMARVFKDLPSLGGWFTIVGSEHHTHCYSHIFDGAKGGKPDCPRCAQRTPSEVAAQLMTDMRDGTRQSSQSAEMIAWNWAWHILEDDPQRQLLSLLPKDMTVLVDWERGGWRNMPSGKRNWIDEYSLLYVGPSERFEATAEEVRKNGLSLVTKLQVGTTHELSDVPNLPLIDNLYEKLCRVENMGLRGLLATWNFGNMFTFNTAAVGRFVHTTERPSPHQFVTEVAAEYFPNCDDKGVAAAVGEFTAAMQYYPFDEHLIYWGPINYAMAYPLTSAPLTGKSMGWSWVMHERGDDLEPTLRQFTLDEVIASFDALVAQWRPAIANYAHALAGCKEPQAKLELGVAKMIGCAYRSTANVYKTYKLRKERPADLEAQFAAVAADEIANLEEALPLLKADSRLGFHAECQAYMFSAELVEAKLKALRSGWA